MNFTTAFKYTYLLAAISANPVFCMLVLNKPHKSQTRTTTDTEFLQTVGNKPFAYLVQDQSASNRLQTIAQKSQDQTLGLIAHVAQLPTDAENTYQDKTMGLASQKQIVTSLVGDNPKAIEKFYYGTSVVNALNRIVRMQPALNNTNISPEEAFTLDDYHFNTCETLCKTGKSTVRVSRPFYNRVCRLPQNIREGFDGKIITVNRTLLEQLMYAGVTISSTALAGASCGLLCHSVGAVPQYENWIRTAIANSHLVCDNKEINQSIAHDITKNIDADALRDTIPALRSTIPHWSMLHNSKTENDIVDEFTTQVCKYAKDNQQQLSKTVVNTGYAYALDFVKEWYIKPYITSSKISAVWGFGFGAIAGLIHALTTMGQPIIETEIPAIGKNTHNTSSFAHKVGHVAKCAAAGAGLGTIGTTCLSVMQNPSTKELFNNLCLEGKPSAIIDSAIKSGETALTSTETQNALAKSIKNHVDQKTINQYERAVTTTYFFEQAIESLEGTNNKQKPGSYGAYRGDSTDTTLQMDVAHLMENQIKSGSTSYANTMVESIHNGAAHTSTMRLIPIVSKLLADVKKGFVGGVTSGFMYGMMTLDDNNQNNNQNKE